MTWFKRKHDPTEATAAKERAEEALAEVRQRREDSATLVRWLRADRTRNHYGELVQAIYQGRRP